MRRQVRRIAVAASLALGLVGPTTLPASADHTPTPASVNLAGSIESEATGGACGDWDPACVAARFAAQPNDVFVFQSAAVPAGSYEYKVAMGSWDENYGADFKQNGPNIAVTLPTERAVRFYYDHKTHFIADDVRGTAYTVPGSFNTQLGCAGDWQPDCLATFMNDVDGDGTFTFVTDQVIPGSYEFKVTAGESWDQNWPAANRAFTVTAPGDKVTVSFTPGPNTVDVVVESGPSSEPGDEDLALDSLRSDLTAENFYFVMADRFADGRDDNDEGGQTGGRLVTGYDPTDKGFYHGGDLAGLTERLDYIKGLGTTAIWMTPSFKNRPVQGAGADVSAGYHGYWITDFTQIDPHLGTNAELKGLVDAAHAKGIKVFFDIITNHTADIVKYAEGQYTYRSKAAYPYVDADGNEFDDRDYAGQDNFPPLNLDSFPYTPTFETAADATVKKPDWLNDRTMYHNRGDTTFVGEDSQYGDFFGLDDLFTERPEVVDGMIDVHKKWISDFGIDGFRVDTVKHVNTEFWQEFAPAIREHASSAGKPDFFLFGEVFDSNPEFLSTYTTTAKLPAVLDFGFQSSAQSFAASSSATDRLRDFFLKDDLYTDRDSNAYSLPTFLGNHDMGRIGRFIRTDAHNDGASDDEILHRDQLAHALMYLTRGMPVVYYGDEQGFTGDGGDKDARQDMFASKVDSYNDDDLIGTDRTTVTDSYEPDHPLYQAIAELSALTKAHPALRNGAQQHRLSSSGAGLYAFSRVDRDEQVEYVVALNNDEAAHPAAVPTYSAGMEFTGVWPAGLDAKTTGADRALSLTVPPLSAVVYKASAKLAASPAAPAVTLIAPPEGSEVKGRVEVGAQVAGKGFNQVTFAVKVGDAADWTVLGTDDNAPYRVYYDTTGLTKGTALKFKAVVKDNAGHFASDTGTAIIGAPDVEPEPGGGSVPDYAVIHYNRPDGEYAGWGLHLWGDGLADGEGTTWDAPKPFQGEDEYGRFAWVKLNPDGGPVNFIVHKGDVKDPDGDRSFNPASTPEIWLTSGEPTVYPSRAAAQGFVEIGYHRPDGVYTGWGLHLWGDGLADGVPTEWATPRMPDRIDEFGAHWTIPIKDAEPPVNFIVHKGDEKDTDGDRLLLPTQVPHAWLMSGDATVHKTRGAAQDFVVIHYHRPDGEYGDPTSADFRDFWGMHVWTGAAAPNPSWQEPVRPAGRDAFGIFFRVPLVDGATNLSYILHRGDTKDPGPDQSLDLTTLGHEVWFLSGHADSKGMAKYVLPMMAGPGVDADLTKARAHWVTSDVLLWDRSPAGGRGYRLHYAPTGGLEAKPTGVTGGKVIRIAPDASAFTDALKEKWPHLADYTAYRVRTSDLAKVPAALTGQLAVSEEDSQGLLRAATGVQIPGVLDDLYATNAKLGVTWSRGRPTLRLWAPTAKSVTLELYADGAAATATSTHAMTKGNALPGVWSVTGTPDWKWKYYRFDVEVFVSSTGKVEHNQVTDPYSLALATNSARSQIVDLSDPSLSPHQWANTVKPALTRFEDLSVYELHVRDFSIGDETAPAEHRGTYAAFTDSASNGMQHLRALSKSGLRMVHLLPAFDIATIEERRADQLTPDCDLGAMPPDSAEQQECVMAVADKDGFNWGYDPFHYTTPEGSYATDPEGAARTREFRAMVQSLNQAGLRVVMDVVYNHTTASGQDPKSVLDRVVPGYYQRLDLEGKVATSTCCANTATEHAMMGKLMVDSVVTWARDYKVDGFRFDLMGHHSKQNMLDVRAALDALTVSKDGVNGRKIYLYGEGWNFGEVANDARFVQATQLNMAGTGIGTFNDRLRDAVRGGGPFDGNPRIQGFGSGLFTDPNGDGVNGDEAAQRSRLQKYMDQIKVGLTGNLADYRFADGRKGSDIDYNGSPAGYNDDPQEAITYVEAHDNETLYDALAFKLPQDTGMADRVRMQVLSQSTVALGQGVPFVHAGGELLRSKSLDRNSYNSGDHFNRLDFTYSTNNFGVGLPPKADNESKWDYMRPLLADPALRVGPDAITATDARVQELLRIRMSSRLFRLGSAALVQERVAFADTDPGVIAMRLADDVGTDLDPRHESIVVVFNATDEVASVQIGAAAGDALALHPVQASGNDPVVRTSSFASSTGTFTIPARTTAVFVERAPAGPRSGV